MSLANLRAIVAAPLTLFAGRGGRVCTQSAVRLIDLGGTKTKLGGGPGLLRLMTGTFGCDGASDKPSPIPKPRPSTTRPTRPKGSIRLAI